MFDLYLKKLKIVEVVEVLLYDNIVPRWYCRVSIEYSDPLIKLYIWNTRDWFLKDPYKIRVMQYLH